MMSEDIPSADESSSSGLVSWAWSAWQEMVDSDRMDYDRHVIGWPFYTRHVNG